MKSTRSIPGFRLVAGLCFAWTLFGPVLAGRVAAQSETLSIPLGEPVFGLTAGSDSTQHYSLYVPSSWSADRELPVLLLMDPRGRARVPLGLFQASAEQYGYLLLSSHETLSDADSAFAVDQRALNAMIRDAQGRFHADPERMYLIGFSGTAHFAWYAGVELDGNVAGIVGVGDGMLASHPGVRMASDMNRPFAYFGMAGTSDFNYENTWRRDRALDDTPLPHRYAEFEGPHSWMPRPLAEDALEWLELTAMRTGMKDVDETWVQAQYAERLDRAGELETGGNLVAAMRAYREIVQDFTGLLDAHVPRLALEALFDRKDVWEADRIRWETAQEVDDFRASMYTFIEEFRAERPPLPFEAVMDRMHVEQLKAQVQGADPVMTGAASRKIASLLAQTGFYEPRTYMENGDYARAEILLRVALELNPGAPHLCLQLAQTRAGMDRFDEALEALECVLRSGLWSPETLRSDPLLAPLRKDARFERLLSGSP